MPDFLEVKTNSVRLPGIWVIPCHRLCSLRRILTDYYGLSRNPSKKLNSGGARWFNLVALYFIMSCGLTVLGLSNVVIWCESRFLVSSSTRYITGIDM